MTVAPTIATPTSWVDLYATTPDVTLTDGQAVKSPSQYACIPDSDTMQECIINAARYARALVDQFWTDHMRKESRTGSRSGMELWWKGLLFLVLEEVHTIASYVRDAKMAIAVN